MAAPPIISARELAVSFGGPPLFAGIELHLSRGDRAALVGRNGCGKTTLMRVLIGAIERDKGELYLEPGLRTVWQEQEPFFDTAMTVADYVADGKHAGFAVDAILEEVALAGERTLGTLSGGEGRRAQLARALVAEPDLLLLDEPTNHLDLATIEWLERRLLAFKGAVMTISHDRAFLANVTNRVLWLERGKLRVADRGFAHFEEWREETLRMEERALEKLDVHLAEETRWLLRGVTARRRRNQGRLARLEEARGRRAAMVGGRRRKLKLDAQEGDSRAKLVIEAKEIMQSVPAADGTGERVLFRDFSLLVVRGDKIGIVGPNGAGKSTLLRTLTGEQAPAAGTVDVAKQLRMAVFDQKREQLPPKATLRDILCPGGGNAVAVRGQNRDVRAYLKDFLFDPRQADSPVATLSGGERNRLLLAKNLATPADLMILDEPTNDLDTDTLDLLIDLLGEFEGTLLVVSHDRDFLDQVVASTIFMPGDGTVTEYAGGFTDAMAQRRAEIRAPARAFAKSDAAAPREAVSRKVKTERPARAPQRLSYKDQRELDLLPQTIAALEAEIAGIERAIAEPDFYARDRAAAERTLRRHGEARAELAAAEDRWLELEERRAALERAKTPAA